MVYVYFFFVVQAIDSIMWVNIGRNIYDVLWKHTEDRMNQDLIKIGWQWRKSLLISCLDQFKMNVIPPQSNFSFDSINPRNKKFHNILISLTHVIFQVQFKHILMLQDLCKLILLPLFHFTFSEYVQPQLPLLFSFELNLRICYFCYFHRKLSSAMGTQGHTLHQ